MSRPGPQRVREDDTRRGLGPRSGHSVEPVPRRGGIRRSQRKRPSIFSVSQTDRSRPDLSFLPDLPSYRWWQVRHEEGPTRLRSAPVVTVGVPDEVSSTCIIHEFLLNHSFPRLWVGCMSERRPKIIGRFRDLMRVNRLPFGLQIFPLHRKGPGGLFSVIVVPRGPSKTKVLSKGMVRE